MSVTFSTLIDLLRSRAREAPGRRAYTFLRDGEAEEGHLTYGGLDRRARAIGALLQSRTAHGDRVLLLYPPGLDYVAAFLGCQYAGAVAVPACPPAAGRLERDLPRLRAVAADSGAALALTTAAWAARAPALAGFGWQATDRLAGEESLANRWREPAARCDDLALLQYTSGSTAEPKGVELTHRNLLHNLEGIRQRYGHTEASRGVSWLPPYHDMGLIGCLLQPLYAGFPVVLFAPAAFLQRPVRWLAAVSRYRATSSGGPDFAYDLCVRKIPEERRRQLDLSAWQVAFSGAETVRPETLDRFAAAFAVCGFRREAFFPCYGLAEATLLVAGGRLAPGAARSRASCGQPLADHTVAIVDPETALPCPPRQEGEIWIAGPSVARGYWNRPEATAATFQARLAGTETGPFLRSGDLGILDGGELFVTGRLKDLIVLDGLNHHAEDLERTAEASHPALHSGACAAFSAEIGGTEKAVLAAELDGRRGRTADPGSEPEVIRAIRHALAAEHGIAVHEVILLPRGRLPRTTSGKVRRGACREAYLAGALAAGSPRRRPVDEIRGWLVRELAVRLGIEPAAIDPGVPFAEHGLSSREAVVLSGDLEAWLGRKLPPALLWQHPTIEALARHLEDPDAATGPAPVEEPRPAGAIAVLGLGCRLPGAAGPEELWRLLETGGDAIREAPPGRQGERPAGFLDGIDLFDARFFRISRLEASRMDPQQRLLLEVAWQALEDAGLAADRLAGSATGVFVGIASCDHARLVAADGGPGDAYLGTGSAFSIAANRLSYVLDLRGPSAAIDTACSSSLVAVHLACRSLQAGDCDLALAGGVHLILSRELEASLARAGLLAADGRSKTFDARADGYGRGEGCGVVVLKRLADALRDGDRVRAVLLGSAVNQDGRSNGLTAPSEAAQREVIRRALAATGIGPERIGYVECHGSGTPLGDLIEVQALAAVFGGRGPEVPPCRLGSIKANLGHLEAAAGVTGLIKTVLAVEKGFLPPQPRLQQVHPDVEEVRQGLEIVAAGRPWPTGSGSGNAPRIAGVSAFGFGGTNAHVVVGEAPARDLPLRPPLSPHQFQRESFRILSRDSGGTTVTTTTPCELPRRQRIAARLTDILARLLETGPAAIDPRSHWLDLGADSITLIQASRALEDTYGLQVPLRRLFDELVNVDALAVYLDGQLPTEDSAAETVPLTDTQELLWTLCRLDEAGSSAYNECAALELPEPADDGALRLALQALTDRHEALRSTVDAGGAQRIAAFARAELESLDFSARGEEALTGWMREERSRAFGLSQGPLWRAWLVRRAGGRTALVLVIHHLIADGWSLGVMLRELVGLYRTAASGGRIAPPAEPLRWRDYVRLLAEQGEGPALAAQESYWLGRFADGVPPLELPADRPRPAAPSYRGAVLGTCLGEGLTAALRETARREGSTPFMVLLAAYFALLHGRTGQGELAVGVDVTGRPFPGSETLIGYCTHLVLVRGRSAGTETVREHRAAVRRALIEAFEHGDYPFARLVRKLGLPRDPARPLPVATTSHLLRPLALPAGFAVDFDLAARSACRSPVDLAFDVAETGADLRLSWTYSSDLFDGATVQRLAGHFQALLAAALAASEHRLADLAPLTAPERAQLLVEWNDTAAVPPIDPFPRLFEQQAARAPEAVAAVCGDASLTYGELHRRARHLARVLAVHGAGPERTVALLAERGLGALTALLATLLAGGAYLPLDPRCPARRLGLLLERSAAPLVLAEGVLVQAAEEAASLLPAGRRPRILSLEKSLAAPAAQTIPCQRIAPQSLACLLYTSGSTGEPKGAMIEHRGLLNHLWVKIGALGLTESDAVAQTAPLSFDISIWQSLAPLLAGGRVCIMADEPACDPAALLGEAERQGVTVLEAVPSFLQGVLAHVRAVWPDRARLAALRWLVLTGEAAPPPACREWLSYYPGVPLLNAYGPTECSDDVAHHRIERPAEDAVRVAIGRPVANLRLYVLDTALQPVPAGTAGELYAAGAGVGRGYLGEPGQTAAAFLPDPFDGAGGRLYRTGDRARLLPDGTLDLLGRTDDQVKLRGWRIEPGEIAAALERHPAVESALVTPWENGAGDLALAAYAVLRPGCATGVAELKSFLQAHLPARMVPADYVLLDAWPLTANGKVDRPALPRPDPARPRVEAAFVPPSTATERAVAAVWGQSLAGARVGLHDNFFDLGGDSVELVKSAGLLDEIFRIRLPLRPVFLNPTVAVLSRLIEQRQTAAA